MHWDHEARAVVAEASPPPLRRPLYQITPVDSGCDFPTALGISPIPLNFWQNPNVRSRIATTRGLADEATAPNSPGRPGSSHLRTAGRRPRRQTSPRFQREHGRLLARGTPRAGEAHAPTPLDVSRVRAWHAPPCASFQGSA